MAFNILIADDSGTMRQVIKKVIGMSGVPVQEFHEAENGEKALKVLEESWIDVILSDINMPEMDGMEFLRRVKANDVYKNIPVIFVTTEASEARMAEARELGAAGYIKKPFLPEVIKDIINEVLGKAYDFNATGGAAGQPGPETDEDMDF